MSVSDPTAAQLRVGITIGLSSPSETLWNNGIKQNAIYLAETLKGCPNVASVVLVNTTPISLAEGVSWDVQRWPVRSFADCKDELDVLIELGGQIDAQATDYLKQQGTHLVSYCCGFEYVHAMEAMIFRRPSWGYNLFINQRYDAVWMVPQVDHISRHYFQTLRRQEARPVPFVWSPLVLDQRCRELDRPAEYAPRPGPRRLSVMEPNHDVVKFCLYPILIAEEAYRARPQDIGFLHVANALSLANESPEFVSLMNHLDLVRDHKAAFVGRFDTPRFLSEFTDVMISHQWENPLNYFYFDVTWLGYPLVHNASMCRDLGYYYPDNDVPAGARMLLQVLEQHDEQWEDYRRRQRTLITRHLPQNKSVIASYANLLAELRSKRPI
ncbi:DUF2827 domain-containing protein [Dyella japonica]|uniref:DUF2827 domain-containing protein n=1 Tax=Dyella japonica A8 TaxID=1217721 RepID=A0A075JZW3_9GAMM|nr:DUF2827 domain-containing protein [Dyella japonica]AIF47611.1 hypothetical protein HY57_10210 [Dyella japonica A8]